MTSQNEDTGAPQANSEKPKPDRKARIAPDGAHVAAKAAKSAKRAIPKEKSAKRAKVAGTRREGSKTAKILDLLKRPMEQQRSS